MMFSKYCYVQVFRIQTHSQGSICFVGMRELTQGVDLTCGEMMSCAVLSLSCVSIFLWLQWVLCICHVVSAVY